MEIWKPIPGFDGYEASSSGHIRNTKTGKQLHESLISSGYLMVSMHGAHKLVHRLVCSAFKESSERRNQVNHKNGNKTDNRPQNLEWVSLADNVRDFWTNSIFAEKQQIRREQVGKCIRGRIWITDGSTNHRIRPEELDNYEGFYLGVTHKSKRGEAE